MTAQRVDGLALEGGVIDVVLRAQELEDAREHLGGLRARLSHNVPGCADHSGRDGPDVEVVYLGDTLEGADPSLESVDVHPLGGRLDEDAQGLAHKVPGPGQDEQADCHTDDRVDPVPAREVQQDRTEDHTDRPDEVSEDLEACALEVDRLLGAGRQQAETDDVDDQAEHRGDEERDAWDLSGVLEPLDGLDEHVSGNREQQDAVCQRGEDFEPVEAEGAVRRGGPICQSDCNECHGEPQHVRAHMGAVRDQSERSDGEADSQLNNHERGGEAECDRERFLVRGTRRNGDVGVTVIV